MFGLSKLYLWGAVALALLTGVGVIYAKGRLDARHAVELRTLKDNIKTLEAAAERERLARVADTMQAKVDREEEEGQEATIKELQDALQDRTRECFASPDADGLRDLLEGSAPAKKAAPATRRPRGVLRQKRKGSR